MFVSIFIGISQNLIESIEIIRYLRKIVKICEICIRFDTVRYIPSKLTACTNRYRGTAVLRAGRAGFTKKSLHLTFQSVQRGTIDGDAAPPIPKLLKDDIEPPAKRFL